ncbi:unnamed protein product [Arabidopsis lyrata]|uniref:Predicted protein n=1 Tax=Arabidopsis lyrata subsp. lyrata TaxID=81972 RepID=D7LTC6_ARALL|nr:predicted protein [Arabidopsis lyrata subsp. lyrata]CAH8269563.1 unnamed protein product [Arabidopsis lyrata]
MGQMGLPKFRPRKVPGLLSAEMRPLRLRRVCGAYVVSPPMISWPFDSYSPGP